ncbi:hypothetical protein ACO22_00399 [Paracoccidioides brasiliensis]|uniref:C2H2-type domain-containing protein n=1 Tax=Paracoccidioides brasiliensis TaxID=121759 RepID=A0A1D2JPU5_PARBR|nr:hypothetical protein ACO22_00399 [Paracoccidioides brasiliensis]
MSQQRRQQSRSSSGQRSRSAQSDQQAASTAAQLEALNISSRTPPPSITVQRTPEYTPSNLSSFVTNVRVPVTREQQDWTSLQMTATVDSNTSSLPFGSDVSNNPISYSSFPVRQEQLSSVHMRGVFDYTISPHSSNFAQQNYYYTGPSQQLPDYGTRNASSMSQGFQGNFDSRISSQQGAILPDGSLNILPPDRHQYSLQSPEMPLAGQHKNRTSSTPIGQEAQGPVSSPRGRQDEYLQPAAFASHSSAETYPNISPSTSSLTLDYVNHAPSNVAGHTLSTSHSLYDPLHPYQSSRQYPFSPISDTGIPVPAAQVDGIGTPYSVSPTPEDQIRIVNSRAKPQCWDHGCNGREFSTFSNLLRHQREKAGTATKSECPHCGTVFTRTTARNGHLAQGKCKAKREVEKRQQQQQLQQQQQQQQQQQE